MSVLRVAGSVIGRSAAPFYNGASLQGEFIYLCKLARNWERCSEEKIRFFCFFVLRVYLRMEQFHVFEFLIYLLCALSVRVCSNELGNVVNDGEVKQGD